MNLARYRKAVAAFLSVLTGAVVAGLITGSAAVWVSLVCTAVGSFFGVAAAPKNQD